MHALFGAETALVGPSAVITEGEKTVWSAGKYVPGVDGVTGATMKVRNNLNFSTVIKFTKTGSGRRLVRNIEKSDCLAQGAAVAIEHGSGSYAFKLA
eukprot:COSAG06_NODE_5663_length_3335_cov_1.450556_5_plen_97_part_00